MARTPERVALPRRALPPINCQPCRQTARSRWSRAGWPRATCCASRRVGPASLDRKRRASRLWKTRRRAAAAAPRLRRPPPPRARGARACWRTSCTPGCSRRRTSSTRCCTPTCGSPPRPALPRSLRCSSPGCVLGGSHGSWRCPSCCLQTHLALFLTLLVSLCHCPPQCSEISCQPLTGRQLCGVHVVTSGRVCRPEKFTA